MRGIIIYPILTKTQYTWIANTAQETHFFLYEPDSLEKPEDGKLERRAKELCRETINSHFSFSQLAPSPGWVQEFLVFALSHCSPVTRIWCVSAYSTMGPAFPEFLIPMLPPTQIFSCSTY